MPKLLQVDFPYSGPFGDDMTTALQDLAKSITQEPGMIWKIWTVNADTQEGGGIYLFADAASAQAYLDMHTIRLNAMGIDTVRGRIFDINAELSAITNAPSL